MVMDKVYKYKEAFSLRDEIGTFPNIEVEIDFSLGHITSKKKIKIYRQRKEKKLCYLGILKEGFSVYSSPVMPISRKVVKDKRVVTDFRHHNVRIAKNNIALPLLQDTFLV